jgi:hypothetical protein
METEDEDVDKQEHHQQTPPEQSVMRDTMDTPLSEMEISSDVPIGQQEGEEEDVPIGERIEVDQLFEKPVINDEIIKQIRDNVDWIMRCISSTESSYQSYYFEDEDTGNVKRIPYEDIYEMDVNKVNPQCFTNLQLAVSSVLMLRSISDDILDAENSLIAICTVLDDLSSNRRITESSIGKLSNMKCITTSAFEQSDIEKLQQLVALNDSNVNDLLLSKILAFSENLKQCFQYQSDEMRERFLAANKCHKELRELKKKQRKVMENDKQEEKNIVDVDLRENNNGEISSPSRKYRPRKKSKTHLPEYMDKMLNKITERVLNMDIHPHKRKKDEFTNEVGVVFDKSKKIKHSESDTESSTSTASSIAGKKCHIWSAEVTYTELQALVTQREKEKEELEKLVEEDVSYKSQYEEKKETYGYLKAIMDEVRMIPGRKITMWYWSREHTDNRQDMGPFISEEDCLAHFNDYVNQIDFLLSENLKL